MNSTDPGPTSDAADADAAPGPPVAPRHRWRRRLLIASAVLAVALLALAAAASWHFSSEVLVPDHSGAPYDIKVHGASPGRVTLARNADTERPGIYGLEWQGGHAIVGRRLAEDEGTVTRRVRAVRGRLAAGLDARVETNVFDGDPQTARGLPFSSVEITTELGPMPAWRIGGRAATWAVFVHGIDGDKVAGLRIAPVLRAAGITSLLISYRNDAGAPPSPDGKHHLGLTEWRDAEAAARFALSHGARRLVMIGYSMGGAIVTQFMERSPLAHRVQALVLDAPALDWQATIAFEASRLHLPNIAAKSVEWAIDLRIDVDWDRLDALNSKGRLQVPTLLFHGTDDDVVPIETSEAFARALSETVAFESVPHAGHVQSWNVAPARYRKRVHTFLASLKGLGAPSSSNPAQGHSPGQGS